MMLIHFKGFITVQLCKKSQVFFVNVFLEIVAIVKKVVLMPVTLNC